LTLTIVLAIFAAVLAGIALWQRRGADLLAWAVLLLALIYLLPLVNL
jgi:hypothetical protein